MMRALATVLLIKTYHDFPHRQSMSGDGQQDQAPLIFFLPVESTQDVILLR